MLEENNLKIKITSLSLLNADASFSHKNDQLLSTSLYKYTLFIYLDSGYSIYLYILIISVWSEIYVFLLQVLIYRNQVYSFLT